MTRHPLLLIADWAHHSWLDSKQPARSERARAAACAQLLARFPMLAEAAATQLPWFAGALSRPAFARLLRTSAALACAYSLRHVITAPARAQFARAIGLPVLAALQCHPRAQREPLRFDPPVDCFNRHSITAAGLAIALRATSGAAQRQWLQLRLPCQCAQDAAQWSLQDTAARTALDLIGDAFLLLDARRTPC